MGRIKGGIMKVAIYTRVSTSDQTTQNQLLDLEEVIERNDWEVVEFYDEVVTGTKGIDERIELARMLKDAQRKKFQKLIIWSVDRLGRNLKNIIGVLTTLQELGIEVYSYKQGIDSSTTMGRSFMAIVGIFAEIENDLRRERQSAGIKRALANGAKFGRKTVITDRFRDEAITYRHEGKSYKAIADLLQSNVATVHKAVNQSLGKG